MGSDASSDVRLLRQDILDAVRRAARRAGLTVEQWLNSAIIDTAADGRPSAAGDAGSRVTEPRIDGGASQGRKRHDEVLAAEVGHTGNRMRSSLRGIRSRLTALAQDLANHDQATREHLAEAIRAINGRIDQLLAAAPSTLARQAPDDVPVLRQGAAASRSVADLQSSLASLESRLDAATSELVSRNQAAPQGLIDLVGELNDQLAQLNARLETRPKPAAHPNASASRAAATVQASLERVEEQLGSMMSEIVPQQQMTTQRLAEVVSELNERLARMNSRGGNARSGQLGARPEHREGRDASLDLGVGRERPIELSSALEEISARQHETDAEVSRDVDPSRADLSQSTTAEATARPMTGEAARELFRQVGDYIADLAQRLDSSDLHLQGVSAIERRVEELQFELKSARAEKAQTEAELAAHQVQTEQGQAKIETLAQELGEFRARQIEIDRRTQEAVQAVHGTLERLLDRLASFDLDLPVEQRVRQASSATASAKSAVSPRMQSQTELGHAQRLCPGDEGSPDQPIEPGPDDPTPHGFSFERSGGADGALGSQMLTEPPSKASFIAAARRAAQAASGLGDDERSEHTPVASRLGSAFAKYRRSAATGAGVLVLVAGSAHFLFAGPSNNSALPSSSVGAEPAQVAAATAARPAEPATVVVVAEPDPMARPSPLAVGSPQPDASAWDRTKKRDEVAARLDQQSLSAAELAVKNSTAIPQPDAAIHVEPPPGGWDRSVELSPAKPKLPPGMGRTASASAG
jgi:localization factor PodJL